MRMSDRIASLKQSYRKVRRHVSQVTGIVTDTYPLRTPYAKEVFYIYAATFPGVCRADSLAQLRQGSQSQSSAIGATRFEAEALAVFEALERFAYVFQGNERRVRGAYQKLKPRAIHPNELLCFSPTQYENRTLLNATYRDAAAFIPEWLGEDDDIEWCPVRSLTTGAERLVPASYLFHGYPHSNGIFALADSNGVAAGPSLPFCVRNGLYELIQRDAAAIWHYGQLKKRRVDFHSFDVPRFERIEAVHRRLGRTLWVLDIRSDLLLYSFVAISQDISSGNIIQGFGTHHNPCQAVERALDECCQMLPNVVDPETRHPRTGGGMMLQQHHLPDNEEPLLSANDYPAAPPVITLKALVDLLAAKDIEVLVHDVTRPDLGLHVARVMASGLRSWYRRLGAGRLYTVPVEQGDWPHPRTEAEMNPVALTF